MALSKIKGLLALALTTGTDIKNKISEIEGLKAGQAADPADQPMENAEIANVRAVKVDSAKQEIKNMIAHLNDALQEGWESDPVDLPPAQPVPAPAPAEQPQAPAPTDPQAPAQPAEPTAPTA
jgi:hypothetical protein